jgi:hypothetical protein
MITELTRNDLHYVVQRLPRDVRDLLSQNGGKLFVGGGFIRATIAGETPSDIDVFGDSKMLLSSVADLLLSRRPGSYLHKTKNAITLITPGRMPVQFITRWVFEKGEHLIASFDFTVCQAAVWRTDAQTNAPWASSTGDGFYVDLAGRRLVYTSPVRDEDAGGSMLRLIKYVKRGYSIQIGSLAAIVSRLNSGVMRARLHDDSEQSYARIVHSLLREVDPMLVIDGIDFVDDHEQPEILDGPEAEGENKNVG